MSETQTSTQPQTDKHKEMMASGVAQAVIVTSDRGNHRPGEVRMQHWDKKARSKRAGRFWMYCWGLALASIALPLLHFVLVPGFLLAGPVGAWVISTQGSAVLGGESACPDCGAFLPISAGTDSWPLQDLCTQCQTRVKVEKA